jgi:uncharacterized cysteine cluster protein YcgN (CxxCxxCC family)
LTNGLAFNSIYNKVHNPIIFRITLTYFWGRQLFNQEAIFYMSNNQISFWKTKTLLEMTLDQWESLCDYCGICCLQKIEDEDTGEIKLVGVSCEFLDTTTCRCLVYDDRSYVNTDCVVLTPDNISQIKWLPDTCAYRRIAEGRGLEKWHPLVSRNPYTVYQAGISVRDKVVDGKYVHPEGIEIVVKRT